MKNIKYTLLFLLMATATLTTSCSEDVEPLDPSVVIPDPIENSKFKVDIDGKTFAATNIQAALSVNSISITGLRSGNNDLIQITLPSPLNQVGTYTWEDALANETTLGLIYSNSSSEAYISAPSQGDYADFPAYTDNATVTISSINTTKKTISGTFQFTGGRIDNEGNLTVKKFTNGFFNEISYTGDVPPTSGNTFLANMYAAPFNPSTITAASSNDKILVTGITTDMGTITVLFPNTVEVGTYPLSSLGDYVAMFLAGSDVNSIFAAESGSLTILSHNTTTKKVKATFNFVGRSPGNETVPITEGSFEVTYQ